MHCRASKMGWFVLWCFQGWFALSPWHCLCTTCTADLLSVQLYIYSSPMTISQDISASQGKSVWRGLQVGPGGPMPNWTLHNFTLSIDLHSTSGQHERACACHQAPLSNAKHSWDMLRPPDRCGRLHHGASGLLAQRHGWLPPLKGAAHRITVDAAGTSHRPEGYGYGSCSRCWGVRHAS